MSRMSRYAAPVWGVAAVLFAGCLDVSGTRETTFPFDLTTEVGQNWTVAVADLAADREADVAVAGEHTAIPAPYSTFNGIRQSGTNVTGDLFVFHKKWIQSPWPPGTTWRASVDMSIVTNQHNGCTTGAGPNVFIKAGVTGDEPLVTPDGQNILRLNLDKGTGASGGEFAQLGDLRNTLEGCPAEGTWQARGTIHANQTAPLVIDANGGFWIFFGTQSSFLGRHELYFTQFRVTLADQ